MDFNFIKLILLIIAIHLIINIINYFFKYHIRIKYYTTNEDIYPDLNKEFAYGFAACFDMKCAKKEGITIEPGKSATIGTGLYFCLPMDLELQVRPKSGLNKAMHPVTLGTVDGDYRGEVCVTIYNLGQEPFEIKYGQKIAQGKIDNVPFLPFMGSKFVSVKDLKEFGKKLNTKRGDKGFGSSGTGV